MYFDGDLQVVFLKNEAWVSLKCREPGNPLKALPKPGKHPAGPWR